MALRSANGWWRIDERVTNHREPLNRVVKYSAKCLANLAPASWLWPASAASSHRPEFNLCSGRFRFIVMMDDQSREYEKISFRIRRSLLKHVDRIAHEKELSRDKVINDILENHFADDDDWLDKLLH